MYAEGVAGAGTREPAPVSQSTVLHTSEMGSGSGLRERPLGRFSVCIRLIGSTKCFSSRSRESRHSLSILSRVLNESRRAYYRTGTCSLATRLKAHGSGSRVVAV